MTILRKEILKCYSQQAAAAKHQWREHFEQLNRPEKHEAGAGGRQGVNLPLCSSDSFAAFYFFHISTAMSLVCVRVANQVTPKRRRGTGRRSPKWRLKEANGKWLVSYCLLTRRALISSFLPVVCVSRAKRKPFGMVVPVWVAISLLCIPCNWELISGVSAAQTYEESLVYK